MKKLIFTLLIPITIVGCILSQNTEVELLFGYQKHDKRFARIYEGLNDNVGMWGTSFWGLKVNKNLLQKGNFRFNVGLGYARETNTYKSPYDHCYGSPGEPCNLALHFIGTYSIDLVLTSLTPGIRLTKNLELSMGIVPQFNFYKKVNGYSLTSGFDFGLYSLEFNPELEYSFGHLNMGLGFRVFQLKTIDKVYLYSHNFLTENPGYLEKTFDTYNPTKITLSMAYVIGVYSAK